MLFAFILFEFSLIGYAGYTAWQKYRIKKVKSTPIEEKKIENLAPERKDTNVNHVKINPVVEEREYNSAEINQGIDKEIQNIAAKAKSEEPSETTNEEINDSESDENEEQITMVKSEFDDYCDRQDNRVNALEEANEKLRAQLKNAAIPQEIMVTEKGTRWTRPKDFGEPPTWQYQKAYDALILVNKVLQESLNILQKRYINLENHLLLRYEFSDDVDVNTDQVRFTLLNHFGHAAIVSELFHDAILMHTRTKLNHATLIKPINAFRKLLQSDRIQTQWGQIEKDYASFELKAKVIQQELTRISKHGTVAQQQALVAQDARLKEIAVELVGEMNALMKTLRQIDFDDVSKKAEMLVKTLDTIKYTKHFFMTAEAYVQYDYNLRVIIHGLLPMTYSENNKNLMIQDIILKLRSDPQLFLAPVNYNYGAIDDNTREKLLAEMTAEMRKSGIKNGIHYSALEDLDSLTLLALPFVCWSFQLIFHSGIYWYNYGELIILSWRKEYNDN